MFETAAAQELLARRERLLRRLQERAPWRSNAAGVSCGSVLNRYLEVKDRASCSCLGLHIEAIRGSDTSIPEAGIFDGLLLGLCSVHVGQSVKFGEDTAPTRSYPSGSRHSTSGRARRPRWRGLVV